MSKFEVDFLVKPKGHSNVLIWASHIVDNDLIVYQKVQDVALGAHKSGGLQLELGQRANTIVHCLVVFAAQL